MVYTISIHIFHLGFVALLYHMQGLPSIQTSLMWTQNLFDHTRCLCVHVLACATQQCCISSLSRFLTTRSMNCDAISCLEILDHLGFSGHIRWDSLAEWSKVSDLGSSPKGRGFKSHSCHEIILLQMCGLLILTRSR